jgi:glutamine amidotransferase
MSDPTIGVLESGSGNLRSVSKALEREGARFEISREVSPDWSGLVLPGVGAFGHTMENLKDARVDLLAYIDSGKPFLGICLGLQVLFESSEESPGVNGLGLMRGKVGRIAGRKVPHMGWNSLDIARESHILAGIRKGDYFYFVHSYAALPEEDVTVATCEYAGQSLTSVVGRDNVHACQFHPEKSGTLGLRIVRNFVAMSREAM